MMGIERVDEGMKCGTTQDAITLGAIESGFGSDVDQVKQLSSNLHPELPMCLDGSPLHALRSVPEGKLLEATRLIMGRYGSVHSRVSQGHRDDRPGEEGRLLGSPGPKAGTQP